jgi:hypothetical protein
MPVVGTAGDAPQLLYGGGELFACRPCYDTAVSLWPKASIELRQGAQVVLKNGQ